MTKTQIRALAALKHMQTAADPHAWHNTRELADVMGCSGRSGLVSSAICALHDQILVEPGRRSMWRLTALGRSGRSLGWERDEAEAALGRAGVCFDSGENEMTTLIQGGSSIATKTRQGPAVPPDLEERNAVWWRDRFARAERLLAEVADAVGAPRGSDYGHVPAAVREALALCTQGDS